MAKKSSINRGVPDHVLMLVAVLTSKRDFEIARVLGWYRIPFAFAPKVIQVDYLVFYQTSTFGSEHANKIETFAEIRGIELVTRKDLIKDEPDHPKADEPYYKIQIGPLVKVLPPISATSWKRITFLYTTGSLFNQAVIINDLVVRSDERKELWHSLREKADRIYLDSDQTDLDAVDASILSLLNGLSVWEDQETW